MLPRQDPKGTDALWGSMQVRLERSLVEWGAQAPWDLAKDRDPFKDSDAYRRLNNARF